LAGRDFWEVPLGLASKRNSEFSTQITKQVHEIYTPVHYPQLSAVSALLPRNPWDIVASSTQSFGL
jgi:hypothetical protein